MEKYQIQLIPLAIKLLGKIKDKREQKLLTKKIEQLKQEPEKQGKPLSGKLKSYRSVRAVGQRYRISNIDSNVPYPIFSSCFISSIIFLFYLFINHFFITNCIMLSQSHKI